MWKNSIRDAHARWRHSRQWARGLEVVRTHRDLLLYACHTGKHLGTEKTTSNPSGSTQTLKQLSSNRCVFQKKEPKSNGLTTVFMVILRLYNVQATEMKLKNNRYTIAIISQFAKCADSWRNITEKSKLATRDTFATHSRMRSYKQLTISREIWKLRQSFFRFVGNLFFQRCFNRY